jgi:FkbM family methyltransferase
MKKVNNFTTVDTIYGKWIVSRSAAYHAETMIKTGIPVHPELAEFMLSIIDTLPDDCVIVDAGSNAGIFSIPFAYSVKDKGGIVYSFEVQKQLFQALCGTAVLNDLDNLNAFNHGLGDSHKTLKIPKVNYSESWDYGILSLVDQDKIDKQQHDTIDISPLDSFELERLDFIKIDIEGMEIQALDGARQTIELHRPWAFIEYWNVDATTLKNWFNGMNYTLYRRGDADVLCCPNEKLAASTLKFNLPLF